MVIIIQSTCQACCAQRNTPAGVYFDVGMETHLVPDLCRAEMLIPVFDLQQRLSASFSSIRRPGVMQVLYIYLLSILPCMVKNG